MRKITTPKKRFPGPTKNPPTQQEVKHKTMAEFQLNSKNRKKIENSSLPTQKGRRADHGDHSESDNEDYKPLAAKKNAGLMSIKGSIDKCTGGEGGIYRTSGRASHQAGYRNRGRSDYRCGNDH